VAIVPPGGACSVALVFHPTKAGTNTAVLRLSAGSAGSQSVNLRGVGTTTSAIRVEPSAHDFGLQLVGETSPSQGFTITNAGGGSAGKVTAVKLTNADDYAIVSQSDACTGITLGPGATCSVAVVFSPKSSGSKPATLQIVTDTGEAATAGLSGASGTTPALTPSVTALAFGSVPTDTATDKTFEVTNTGDLPTKQPVAITLPAGVAAFAVFANTCEKILAPGEKCSFTVRVLTGTTGPLSGTIGLEAGGVKASLPVTATVKTKATLAFVPVTPDDPAHWGYVGTGESRVWSFELHSQGAFDAGPIAITLAGSQWTLTKNECENQTLGPKTTTEPSCKVEITFTPIDAGGTDVQATLKASAPAQAATASIIQKDRGATHCATPDTACTPSTWCSQSLGCSPRRKFGEDCTNNVQCQYGCDATTQVCCSSGCL
jgi:hypothetical protein